MRSGTRGSTWARCGRRRNGSSGGGVRFKLTGRAVDLDAHPMKRLLDVLREECALTGTKEGCGEGECGACTVLVNGAPVNSCLVPFAQVARADVTTVEGLGGTHPLQRAFVELGGAQSGICTPGMIMAAVALGTRPTLDDMRKGLAGNLCRCTGYGAIYRSIRRASRPIRRPRLPFVRPPARPVPPAPFLRPPAVLHRRLLEPRTLRDALRMLHDEGP